MNEDELPERYRPLLRRLQKAVADPVVRETMDGEDDIIEELKDYQRLISSKEGIIRAKEQLIEEKENTIEEKEQLIGAIEQVIEEKEKLIGEKEKTIEETRTRLERAVLKSHAAGNGVEALASIFELTEAEVAEILKSAT